jgi:signal-transduction protein with cAMP-binding, CBS, and nucleotidyltransferase domain
MSKDIKTVNIDDSVSSVEVMLKSTNLSFVVVTDSKGETFGLISAKDIVCFHAMKENPKITHAWEICKHKTIDATPNITIKDAAMLLITNDINHLLIKEHDYLEGIVSSLDIIRALLLMSTNSITKAESEALSLADRHGERSEGG